MQLRGGSNGYFSVGVPTTMSSLPRQFPFLRIQPEEAGGVFRQLATNWFSLMRPAATQGIHETGVLYSRQAVGDLQIIFCPSVKAAMVEEMVSMLLSHGLPEGSLTDWNAGGEQIFGPFKIRSNSWNHQDEILGGARHNFAPRCLALRASCRPASLLRRDNVDGASDNCRCR